jgi:glycosyltransferase involved in cell wall biosynthesis
MFKDTMNYLEQRQANDRSFTYELIIVDDGSPDKTSEVKSIKIKKKFFSSSFFRLHLNIVLNMGQILFEY